MLDLSDLLLPISEDSPCGERQNNSAVFFEMQGAKGGEERQSFSGDGPAVVKKMIVIGSWLKKMPRNYSRIVTT